jgi:poly-gamma-glutamate synthesis protein (capsule biosynthesis protein)
LTLIVVLLTIGLLAPCNNELTLALTGDVMLGRSVAQANAEGGWDQVLATLAPYVASADLAFANLESPLTRTPLTANGYDLRAPPEAVEALVASGFDLVSLANNHALDAGATGLSQTRNVLRSAGIDAAGPGDDHLLVIIDGISLTWLALDDVSHPIDMEHVRERIATARGRGDFLIVSIHWGVEFETSPSERQRLVAFELAKAGADLIVGHHSHVLQPVEWIWGAGRGRPTLVVYGLGNAIFDQGAPRKARQGATLLVDIDPGGLRISQAVPHQIEPGSWRTAPAGTQISFEVAESLSMACERVRGCR